MNSFSATLHVGDLIVPVLSCSQHVHQHTDLRGQASSPTFTGELRLHLALPRGILLPHWAYETHLPLNGYVDFAAIDGVSGGARLEFEEGYCVSFDEHFEPRVPGQPALHCRISIVARRITKRGTVYESVWPPTGH